MTTISNAASQPTIQIVQPKKEVLLKKEEQSKETKKGISTTTKVVIGTGLAALAAVGIYIATKGKSKSIEGAKKVLSTNYASLPLNEFKTKGYTFVKGRALMPNGEPFNGMIKTKNGGFMIYENGLLQKSVIKKAKNMPSVTKTYTYDSNNKLIEVLRKSVNGEKTVTKFKRSPWYKIGSIERAGKPSISFEYDCGKLNKMVEKVPDKFSRDSGLFYDEITITEFARNADGKAVIKKLPPKKTNFHEFYDFTYID